MHVSHDKTNASVSYSYGTILGATFAAIKPNLVRRMVLDGVSDSESYFNDLIQWGRDGMQNTNKVRVLWINIQLFLTLY
jgi:pimeloyl-ACP methyl ester carboxylesterase